MSKIAFAPLARPTFDVPLAQEVTQAAIAQLQRAGSDLLLPDSLIADLNGTQAYLASLERQEIDLLLVFQATFADSTLAVGLVEGLKARGLTPPVFLWAVPEAPTGGRLRLNSLCGINLAGHALSQRGVKYEYAYAAPEDPTVLKQVKALAAAGMLRRRLKEARLGVVGEHPAGMDSCHLDEAQLGQVLGIQVERVPLAQVFARSRAAAPEQISAVRQVLDQRLDNLHELDQTPLNGTLSVYLSLREVAQEKRVDGLAVRCWPEFFTDLGCSACGAMSMLSDGLGQHNPIPCSCEADANGTVTQLMLHWLAGEPSFGTDIVAMDFEQDFISLWHCGLAPLSMANPNYQPHGTIHSNRKVPLVMEFPLKPGVVTIARLNRHDGQLRLVVGRGEMLDAPAPFSGTSGRLRLETPTRRFFDTLMQEGLEHHISLVYGDYVAELQAFARLSSLPVLALL
ncbi:MAG: L-fucose/L-arabinose isomerase family protein [Anaerolineales bacterium]|nr:L-fucose/L-arabinose isomerase family protein [Anaerolineales bacterium]